MYIINYILFYLLLLYPEYDVIFSSGYENALTFLKENHELIDTIIDEDEQKRAVILSIGFPELIRYSLLMDFFEAKANEIIYINYGKDEADFSIGRFQMKPSFIEKMEVYVRNSYLLSERYKRIYNFANDSTLKEIRKERIERLKSTEWQLFYLNCFYDIMDERFSHVTWKNMEGKIRFYATGYNHNFNATKKNIEQWIDKEIFPYGMKSDKNQYSYSNISVYFYENHWKEIAELLK